MRGFLALAITAMFVFVPISAANAAKVSKDEIVENLSAQGYAVQSVGKNSLFVRVAEYDIRIDLEGSDGDISYRAWLFEVDSKNVGYKVLNQFNNDTKFGRVYVDKDGDLTLQMDRNSTGGSSIKNIESDFDVFLMLIYTFMTHIESQVIA